MECNALWFLHMLSYHVYELIFARLGWVPLQKDTLLSVTRCKVCILAILFAFHTYACVGISSCCFTGVLPLLAPAPPHILLHIASRSSYIKLFTPPSNNFISFKTWKRTPRETQTYMNPATWVLTKGTLDNGTQVNLWQYSSEIVDGMHN